MQMAFPAGDALYGVALEEEPFWSCSHTSRIHSHLSCAVAYEFSSSGCSSTTWNTLDTVPTPSLAADGLYACAPSAPNWWQNCLRKLRKHVAPWRIMGLDGRYVCVPIGLLACRMFSHIWNSCRQSFPLVPYANFHESAMPVSNRIASDNAHSRMVFPLQVNGFVDELAKTVAW